jgi:GTP-binding protein LepA
VLLVDASQGVEAQTVANAYLALENDLEIIPVANKVDMPNADIENTEKEIEDLIGLDSAECLQTSGKTGQGVLELLEKVVHEVPSPAEKVEEKLRALVFDAHYDRYKGVIIHVRLFGGSVKIGDKVELMHTKKRYEVSEVGLFSPKMTEKDILEAGEVGYIVAGIKEASEARVGETVTMAFDPTEKPLEGYKEVKAMVYAGIYPGTPEYFIELRKALEKLKLNDAALSFESESSPALGFGFRCGFLGLLHMDVVRERLEREFDIAVILTAPNVVLQLENEAGERTDVTDPAKYPDMPVKTYEPYVELTVITPNEFMGNLMGYIQQEKRGIFNHMENAGKDRLVLYYEIPLSEIIYDFFDKLKAKTRGYGSMDYNFKEYRESDMIKLKILLNREPVEALSIVVHTSKKDYMARELAKKLKDLIPQHQFEVPVQVQAGARVIARETVKALRKDVLAKCYGGDVTRKMKLLDKQKEGKKKLRSIGRVTVPQEAFLAILSVGEDE